MVKEEAAGNTPNWAEFKGYCTPRYTSVPDQLFDEHLAYVSGAELKVLLYVVRRTFGWSKDSDNISLSQLLTGIITREGHRLDSGTGLSRSTLVAALKTLVDKRLILVERRGSRKRGDKATNYRLNVAFEEDGTAALDLSPKIELGGFENRTGGVRKSNPQETDLQDTSLQHPSKIRMTPAPNRSLGQADGEESPAAQGNDGPKTDAAGPPAPLLPKKRTRQKRSSDERQRIVTFIQDFAAELNDEAPLPSSVSRAHNLWKRSGIPIEAFSSRMYEARSLTQEHSASIARLSTGTGDGWGGPKNKMAYYFAVLESLVERHSSEDSSTQVPTQSADSGEPRAAAPVAQAVQSESSQNEASDAPALVQAARSAAERPADPSKTGSPSDSLQTGQDLWQLVKEELSDLGPAHQQWLETAEGEERDGSLVLSVRDELARRWIEARLLPAIKLAVAVVGRPELGVEVTG